MFCPCFFCFFLISPLLYLLLQFMNQTRQGMGLKMDSMGGNPGMRPGMQPGMQPGMGGQVSCHCCCLDAK